MATPELEDFGMMMSVLFFVVLVALALGLVLDLVSEARALREDRDERCGG